MCFACVRTRVCVCVYVRVFMVIDKLYRTKKSWTLSTVRLFNTKMNIRKPI